MDVAPRLHSLGDGVFSTVPAGGRVGSGIAVAAGCEFKLAWRLPGASAWRWLPGPNRIMTGESALCLSWPAGCDGLDVIASDGYLEPQRGELSAR